MSIIMPSNDARQLLPLEMPWAYQKYQDGCANSWFPREVPLQKDIEQWMASSVLTPTQRDVVKANLGFFTASESMVQDNLAIRIYEWVTNPECRMYLSRQMFEESVHSDTFIYIIESLQLDETEIYTMYKNMGEIKRKHDFLNDLTAQGMPILYKLLAYYVILEGMWFYTSFVQLLSLGTRNLMPGLCELVNFVLRDESLHISFGIDLINQLRNEGHGQSEWANFDKDAARIIQEAVDIEREVCIVRTLQYPLSGVSTEQCIAYLEYIADRRLTQLGLPVLYNQTESPFPWMAEMVDIRKEKNFFETTVTDYKSAGTLTWD